MDDYNFEMIDEPNEAIERSDDEKILFISEGNLKNDVSEFIAAKTNFNNATAEEPFLVDVQLESINTRKAGHVLRILNSVLLYFDVKKISVIWNYEATDTKAYELGLKIRALTRINFSFQVY